MAQSQLAAHYTKPIDHPTILNIISRKKAAGLYRLHPEVPEDSGGAGRSSMAVSYTHLRAHETSAHL
eukprot:9026276-Alexandrium_andersonii.AAC.1